jgi:hypothetical protein
MSGTVLWLQVPRNLKLIAVPIFELHDHVTRYGPVIAALPLLLSRLQFTLAVSQAAPSRPPPAAQPEAASQNHAPNFGGHGSVAPSPVQHGQVTPPMEHSYLGGVESMPGPYSGHEGYGMM